MNMTEAATQTVEKRNLPLLLNREVTLNLCIGERRPVSLSITADARGGDWVWRDIASFGEMREMRTVLKSEAERLTIMLAAAPVIYPAGLSFSQYSGRGKNF